MIAVSIFQSISAPSSPQSPLAGTERLPCRVEALIQGWEVWYSPSHSLSICALFVMRGFYRSRNSSLASDPISDLNILAVPPCKCGDEKSCPFTTALHSSISPWHFRPLGASEPLAAWQACSEILTLPSNSKRVSPLLCPKPTQPHYICV